MEMAAAAPLQPDDERIRWHLAPASQLFDVDRTRKGDQVYYQMREHFQKQLNELQKGSPSKWAYFEFTGYGTINAKAVVDAHDPRVHYVGMNAGAIPGTLDAMAAIMSHPHLMMHIGNPALEKLPMRDASDGFTTHALLEPIEGTSDLRMISSRFDPLGEERLRFAWILSYFVLEYMFLHEAAHVICGHTNYARSLGLELHAQCDRCATTEEAYDYQAMEFDADNFAFQTMAVQVLSRNTILLGPEQLGSMTDDALLDAWGTATTIFFRLCDQAAHPLDKYDRLSHPHPDVRFTLCQETTYSALAQNGHTELAERWREIHVRAVRNVAEAWRVLKVPGGFYTNLATNGAGIRSRYHAIAQSLLKLHQEIRPWDARSGAK